MQANTNSVTDLRRLSASELAQLGEDSLRDHITAQAVVAHHKHAPLAFVGLEALLSDAECLRYPTRLVFEFGEMAGHQFADPGPDLRSLERGCHLGQGEAIRGGSGATSHRFGTA